MCPHWDFSQGEEARTGSLLTRLSSPSIPIHSFFPHSSSSFLVLLLYIKSQDQVTRSGSSHINRTTRSLEKLFYFSRKSGFIVSTKKKKKNKTLFWLSEAKQWIFFFALLPQKVPIHNPHPHTHPSLFCRSQTGRLSETCPKDVTLGPCAKRDAILRVSWVNKLIKESHFILKVSKP